VKTIQVSKAYDHEPWEQAQRTNFTSIYEVEGSAEGSMEDVKIGLRIWEHGQAINMSQIEKYVSVKFVDWDMKRVDGEQCGDLMCFAG